MFIDCSLTNFNQTQRQANIYDHIYMNETYETLPFVTVSNSPQTSMSLEVPLALESGMVRLVVRASFCVENVVLSFLACYVSLA